MTKFYKVSDGQGKVHWLVAHVENSENRMFAWLANTEKWHRSVVLENAFYALAPEVSFELIEPSEAARMASEWPKLDQKRAGWLIDELKKAPSQTSRELGLPLIRNSRPVTDRQVYTDLEKSRGWVIVTQYNEDRVKAARSLASDLRRGQRKTLSSLGELEARVRPEGKKVVVEAKRKEQETTN